MAHKKIRDWRQLWVIINFVTTLLCIETPRIVESAKQGTPPMLPSNYQGSGNVLQALLNASWPAAQGPTTTFTFFAPQNKAVKVKFRNLSTSWSTLKTICISKI
jgi:hypothetical protein